MPIAATEPKAQTARREQFVDLTFIQELDNSEFIDRLYKAKPIVVAEKPPRLPDQPVNYTVKAGNALSHLAEWFYGSVLKWQKIYEANRTVILKPDYIYIGQKITISSAARDGLLFAPIRPRDIVSHLPSLYLFARAEIFE